MLLMELFTKAVDFKWSPGVSTKQSADFTIDGLIYTVYMTVMSDSRSEAEFELISPHEVFNDVWEITFDVSTSTSWRDINLDHITGTGNAIAVFSTVIAIIQDAINRNHITNLHFSADNSEPSRVKLYDRMSKYFAKQGWRYINDKELNTRSEYDDNSNNFEAGQGNSVYLLTKQPHPHSLLKGTRA